MKKFKESLQKMMGLGSPPQLRDGLYILKSSYGLENDQFRCGRIITDEKSCLVHISDMGNNKYVEWQVQGDEIFVAARSMARAVRTVAAVNEYFFDANSITEGELDLFAMVHPWAVSAINVLADVIFKEHEDISYCKP